MGAAIACLVGITMGMADASMIERWGGFALFGLIASFLAREILVRRRTQRREHALRSKLRDHQEANRLLRLTEATAKVGHWRVDLASEEVYWSDGTFAIHGIEPGDTPSLDKAIECYHPDDRHIVNQAVEFSRKSGKPYTFRARLIRADGEVRFTESTALVEFDQAGEPVALFGVFGDRTEEEEMHRELRHARNEARAMAQAKTAFLAKMSHEIRTPMNGVMGFAELLSLSELNREQGRHVDLILESGKTLQTLLNDILDLSKIESGNVEIIEAATNPSHLVRRVTQLVEPLAREKAIDLRHEIDPTLPPFVLLDGLRLRQILNNLLSNAIRFTDRGTVSLAVKHSDGKLTFTISDTGIGIADTMQEEIFNAFTQDKRSGAKQRGGTGLGLAISRQLAHLMGGTLSVQSMVGNGSSFTLTLPLTPAEPPEGRKAPSPSITGDPCNGCSCRILLAEDYDINQELICEMGRRLGFTFEVAEDGSQAVDMVIDARNAGQPYSLVLMDLQMPRMNGIEAVSAIRKAGIDAAELPVIALTANAFADDVEACLAAGMQEHVAKPIELMQLRDAIKRWLRGYKTAGQSFVNSTSRAVAGSSELRRHCRRS